MDQHCKDNHFLNKDSNGGQPNRRLIDPVIVDVTQVEISMVTQTILVQIDNDATACFDQIMPHIFFLCL